jgi:two-component system response regulator
MTNLLPILLAEDSKHDVMAVKRAWKQHAIPNELFVVRDGEECLDYLHKRGKYTPPEEAPFPGVLLLDINMPKVNGLDVLRHIRNDPDLKRLPVVVLTTSKRDEDLLESYDLNVNAYVAKPLHFDEFSAAINTIYQFWKIVEQPR